MDTNLNGYEEGRGLTREEYIRLARESCKRNYVGEYKEIKEDIINYTDSTDLPVESDLTAKEAINAIERNKISINNTTQQLQKKPKNIFERFRIKDKNTIKEEDLMSLRLLTIRCICALIILISIILGDKYQVSLFSLNSNSIYEKLSSNQGIETLEDFFVNLSNGK